MTPTRATAALLFAIVQLMAREAAADETCEHTHHPDEHGGARVDDEAGEPQALGEHAHHTGGGGAIRAGVSVGLVLADYDARLYSGHYAGTVVGGSVGRGRYELSVKMPAYRIVENGRELYGVGDLTVHAHATTFARRTVTAGAMLMASAPTGDASHGLGMGHVMLMPEAWIAWAPSVASVTASIGYGHAFGGAAAHAEHGGGQWPLVDPMNARELIGSVSVLAPLAPTVGVGVRVRGGTPIGNGSDRLSGGVAVVWRVGQVVLGFDLQRGLVGDPFGTRGSLEMSLSF